jgi:hypothetical protein
MPLPLSKGYNRIICSKSTKCLLSCYLPLTTPGLRYFYIPLFILARVVQWLRSTLLKGHSRVVVSILRTETNRVSGTLCSLRFRIRTAYITRNPSNSDCYTLSSELLLIYFTVNTLQEWKSLYSVSTSWSRHTEGFYSLRLLVQSTT